MKLPKEPVDEWFNMLADNNTTAMLRLYAHVSADAISVVNECFYFTRRDDI